MTTRSRIALLALMFCAAACTDQSRPAPAAGLVDGPDESAESTKVEPSSRVDGLSRHAVPLGDLELRRVVDEVMSSAYPDSHDAAAGCWRYVLQVPVRDEEVAYCMRPQPAQQIPASDGSTTVYVFAANATDLGDNLDYAYSGVDAGLMAAFQISIAADGSWKLLASAKGMEFGTAGACGCEQARFTRLGADYYGWMFTSGGMWQGVLATQHEIVAPHEGGFKNLSAVPEIREEQQNVRYVLSVVNDEAAREFYPLRVEKMREGRKLGELTLEFDRARWAYSDIGNF